MVNVTVIYVNKEKTYSEILTSHKIFVKLKFKMKINGF